MSALGQLIRARRRELGLTQAQLATKAGISVSYICGIEKDDKKPGIDVAASLARALGLPAEEFFRATVEDAGQQPEEMDGAQQVGIDLRDYFAARVMQARLSRAPDPLPAPQWFGPGHEESDARACYAIADAMLKARSA